LIANRIFIQGATPLDFKPELGVVVAFLLLVVLRPLLLFAPPFGSAARRLTRVRRPGPAAMCGSSTTNGFAAAPLLANRWVGSADIRSLADLRNSFEIIQSMRVASVTKGVVVQLAVITLLPVAPLLLTMLSLEELVTRLLQPIF
jgi:hypothetical protein